MSMELNARDLIVWHDDYGYHVTKNWLRVPDEAIASKYVRADIHDALRAELEEVRAVLVWLYDDPSGTGEGLVSEPEDRADVDAWLARKPANFDAILARALTEGKP